MQLVINSAGTYITQKDGIFRLKNKDRSFDVSPQKVESIVVSNQAMITTQAIVAALENNIDIIFLDGYGDPIGRVWFAKMGSTALIRRKQLEIAEDKKGLELVTDMIRKKIENQTGFLKKLMYARPGKESFFENPIKIIDSALAGLDMYNGTVEDSRNSIMGVEGTACRAYFQCLSRLMPEKYIFRGRSRQPAKDPFNAVLNYCYGILYSRIEKACILAGLDPYVGFLHTDNYNKKSMVFDLIEPFRIFAEQTAVYLFTGKKIKDEYFRTTDNAVSLNDKGKPLVIDAINSHMDETVRYRKKNVKRKYIPQHEAHRLANILLADEGEKRPEWLGIKEF
ncbi:CRISP-associated protein Cas1 [Desulfosarcina sp. BuS5]|uniref:CRISPR-associated endonuclease Cas1 n=1 Tax=Desulfosarcina sp. BuS5 TaxID=933262 RepID=UPI00047F81BB|nr:CRISPR-associated endonuclease Cas1 [Desulfosarcina sp. BuS5]WDN88645.1 CRISP-associated protein Cas1 [Desulfosarcina sp. BuS5]